MISKLPRRFIVIVIIIFTLLNIGFFYFLTFTPPHNVFIADQKNFSVSIVWTTQKPEKSTVYFSKQAYILNLLPVFAFFIPSISENSPLINHRITLKNIEKNTPYYFVISYGIHNYHVFRLATLDNTGKLVVKPEIINLPRILSGNQTDQALFNIKGKIIDSKKNSLNNLLILSLHTNGRVFSTKSNQNGDFILSLPQDNQKVLLRFLNGLKQKNLLLNSITQNLDLAVTF